ncbi:MAG: glycosyltransferase, partial [Candidatus Delongbacteria bacterium]
MNKTLIIIPAFNEAGSIEKVVADIREHRKDCDLLVINDCSTDNTSEVARGLK